MSDDGYEGTNHLVPFSYIVTLIVPIVAPLFAYGLYREGKYQHAVAVLALAVIWSVLLFGYLL